MKKYLSIFMFFAVLALMLSTSVVRAEDNYDGDNNGGRPDFNKEWQDKRDEFRDNVKGLREAFRTKMEGERKAFLDDLKSKRAAFLAEVKARKEEFKKAREEDKKVFCERASEMLEKRFENATSQLERFQAKAGEFITKLNDEGKDTTVATEALNLSKQKLADSKTKVEDLKKLVPADCTSITPELFEQIKLGAREAKDLLKESREALHQAVKEIRSLKGEDKEEEGDDDSDN